MKNAQNNTCIERSRNIPELRFPEFSDKWRITKTKDIAPLQRGFDLTNSNMVKGVYPVVFSNGISKFHKVFKVKGPGVVTGRSGTIGKVTFVEEDYWPHNTSLWVTDFKENYPKFIYYFYLNFKLERFNAGSTVPTLNRNDVHIIMKAIPELQEQQKIASFLTVVDTKITQFTKKKALLEQYKKGVMQQIFNQETDKGGSQTPKENKKSSEQIRFKDNEGNVYSKWKVKILGEIGNTLNGLTGKTKENFGEGKPYIQYKQIFDASKIDISNCGLVEISSTEKQSKVQYGDVFFTTSSETPNEIGTASVLLDKVDDMYLNSFCFGYRVNQKILYPSYSQFLFRSENFRKMMIPLAQGSTRYNISKSSFVKLQVQLPCIEEQTKIANFLSSIDGKISQVANQLEKTRAFKKGLLEQLFV